MVRRKLSLARTPQTAQSLTMYVPSVIVILMTILTMIRLPLPGFDIVNPALSVIAIAYFSVWHRAFVPYAIAMACGLLYDASQHTLFGSYALLFMLVRWGSGWVGHTFGFPEHWLKNWLVFIAIATMFFATEALLVHITTDGYLFSAEMRTRIMLTLLVYPLLAYCFASILIALQKRKL